nr:hypothetical protein [Mycobacterium lepromatosis]
MGQAEAGPASDRWVEKTFGAQVIRDSNFLSGEAEPFTKAIGNAVMSGSFVVAGTGSYRATMVVLQAYDVQLTEEESKCTLVKFKLHKVLAGSCSSSSAY